MLRRVDVETRDERVPHAARAATRRVKRERHVLRSGVVVVLHHQPLASVGRVAAHRQHGVSDG